MESVIIDNNINRTNWVKVKEEISMPGRDIYNTSTLVVQGLEKKWVEFKVLLTIIGIAYPCYKSIQKIRKAIKGIRSFMKSVMGSEQKRRFMLVDGHYHFGLYAPAFPSSRYNDFIRTELNKWVPHDQSVNRFQTIHLAITNKCPMQCEHCFEWNNLNHSEVFTAEELKKIIKAIQQEGCTQIYFTGGEPLVRFRKLEEVIQYASDKSECWVVTSGLNLTLDHAVRLKNAGATGVLISLDHFDSQSHNHFRGSDNIFEAAMQAVTNANHVKLVTAFSLCLTRSFITEENLLKYAMLAKNCGVSFVQMLEPKSTGHYEGKTVTLLKEHYEILDEFYFNINYDPAYRNFPVFIYHGYHERKIGCLMAGNWSMYLDSAGYMNPCPFCHTRNYDAHDLLSGKLKLSEMKWDGCPSRRISEALKMEAFHQIE